MNQDVDENRKLFWKKVCNVNGVKVESCCRIKDGNERLALGEDEIRRILKNYFEYPHSRALMVLREVTSSEENRLE